MCLQCEPENYHDCCRLYHAVMLDITYSKNITVPKLRSRKVAHHLYAVWADGIGNAHCIAACCGLSAKNEFIATYLIVDEAELELNRMYALEDRRPEG